MKKGFTLIELLIVLAVISALLSVATPVALRSVAKAKATQVAMNLRNVDSALEQALLLYPDEFNPTALSGKNILFELYNKGFINVDLSTKGYQVVYDDKDKKYLIKYTNNDIDPILVKSAYPAVKQNDDGELYVEVNLQ
ncbi:type IV pilin-related protein [Thermosipho africanus Ob7]|uniref:type II secretion system protein n=1 Tax=Thermosipho africanus TaxID=2421 RepID=UPI000E0C0196|nr:type II secretion system protein [Thermosipho africanus]RDI91877.1 type IV pilin-related protein [Thermosipho africanus Ob7]